MKTDTYRCLLIGDSTLNPLIPFLQEGPPPIEVTLAPFDQVSQVLLDHSLPCWNPLPDIVVIWTRPERAVPAFGKRLYGIDVKDRTIIKEVNEFTALIAQIAPNVRLVLVASWALPYLNRGLGMIDFRHPMGITPSLMRMNLQLTEKLKSLPNVFILNSQYWIASAGENAHDPKMWALGKISFGRKVFIEAALDIKAAIAGTFGQGKKLIALDLDNTMWGGIVGEVGWENLSIGGTDPIGESFAEFQRALLTLKRWGILLAIVSKNEESTALEAINKHPEMVLRRDDFAGWRINWNDKAENLVDLVTELNLGLQSVVFIDDHPAERARIKETLPEVFVPDWPEDPALFAQTIRRLRCFDMPAITKEDSVRTQQYVAERRRREIKKNFSSIEDWLKTLQLRVTVECINRANLPRAAQMLNKTNQFNLVTRRMSESELWQWSQHKNHYIWLFRVSDRFGDYGTTGLASLRIEAGSAYIDDFLLSCRVMGRGVEQTMLHKAISYVRVSDVSRLIGRYIPTSKNKPCADFLSGSGFQQDNEPTTYIWPIEKDFPLPSHIELIEIDSEKVNKESYEESHI
ncbi:MAG: HAD-IIIC family phosphatase [Nitrospirae bacterium]|nr:HAD-IIIC family phosphatase [Nitrospirota bacterium]